MEQLQDVAVVGTARRQFPTLITGTEIDALLETLPDTSSEWRLLLAAGLFAVYRRAGYVPPLAPAPAPAPEEILPSCSKEAGTVISSILERKRPGYTAQPAGIPAVDAGLNDVEDLLPEVLQLLRQRGLRLRHVLLPPFLQVTSETMRALLFPVMGERGKWLARYNPAWAWAMAPYEGEEQRLPPEAEQLWQEGKEPVRLDIFKLHRRVNPVAALSRLEEVFSQERHEFRSRLVAALEIGRSPADQPFLEQTLDDRSIEVRRQAVNLLARFPESDCAQRLRERADRMLSWKPGHVKAGQLTAKLVVTPPTVFDPAWAREGLQSNVQVSGIDKPGWWLVEMLSLVPVRHWVERFGEPLDRLVAGLNGERQREVLEAWTRAAELHEETDLMPALWDGWWERRDERYRRAQVSTQMWQILAHGMEPSHAEERLARFMRDLAGSDATCGSVLQQVPIPWPEGLAEAYLHVLTETMQSLLKGINPLEGWLHVLAPGARSIPHQSIPPALELVALSEAIDEKHANWRKAFDVVAEKLQIRQRFWEELGR